MCRPDRVDHQSSRDTLDWRRAGCIDFCDHRDVRVDESIAILRAHLVHPIETIRLEDGDDSTSARFGARRSQRRDDLCGQMGIVIHECRATRRTANVEATRHTVKSMDRRASIAKIDTPDMGSGNCTQCIAHIVDTPLFDIDPIASRSVHESEIDSSRVQFDIHRSVLATFYSEARYVSAASEFTRTRIVETHHDRTIHHGDETLETANDLVERTKVVEVVDIDVGDHRCAQRQLQMRRVALVRFNHQHVTTAPMGVRTRQ